MDLFLGVRGAFRKLGTCVKLKYHYDSTKAKDQVALFSFSF